MPYQLGLPAALRARGLVVELVPGWETRGSASFTPRGALCHWTAGPRGSKTRPSLNICTHGRADLPGPLCNVYLDRNGVAVVVAAGRPNHAGAGNWRGLTGNSVLFGTEAEAADGSDFTAAQRAAYPKINAAFADLGGFGADMVAGHSEFALPKGRKVDINGYTMDALRAQVAALLANPTTPEDDMPLTDADLTRVADRVWTRTAAAGGPHAIHMVSGTDAKTGELLHLARAQGSAITALSGLLAAQANDLTEAQVEAAVRRAMADVVKVDVSVEGTAA